MSTKKKISDIDKAIEEMQQRRDECFKHIGKAMYESCPELGDMSVAESSAEAGWGWGASGGSKGAVKTAPSRAGRVTTKRRNFRRS